MSRLSGFISIWQQTSGPDDRGHAAPGTGGRPGTCWAGDPAFSHNRHVKGLEPGSRALQTSQSERGNRLLQAGGGRRSGRKWAERWAGDVGMMAEPAPNRPIPTVSGKWPPPARPGREQDRATLESWSRRAIGSPASQRLAPLAIVEKGPLVCSFRLLHHISIDLPPESGLRLGGEEDMATDGPVSPCPNSLKLTRAPLSACFAPVFPLLGR